MLKEKKSRSKSNSKEVAAPKISQNVMDTY